MSDTNTVATAEAKEPTIIKVRVIKAKTTIDVNLDTLPNEVYMECIKEGAQVLVNSNPEMNKLKAGDYTGEEEKYKANAQEVARARVQAMYEGKIKLKAEKAAAASGAVMTEARRLAKIIVKEAMRAQGFKVSHYSASEITAAANDVIKADPGILAQAEKNLAERGKLKVASIDTVVASMSEDPKLVAKAEADKAARKKDKAPLSALQAGKVAPHAGATH